MITFFCSPRAFDDGHIALIQRNAIQSWLAIDPKPEILLIGDEFGVSRIAEEFSIRHIPNVETDPRGIPLRSSMCKIAHTEATHDLLCIINADILIIDFLYTAIRKIPLDKFLAAGRRHDLEVRKPIPFSDPSWRSGVWQRVVQDGTLRGPSTIDYALYSRSISPPILPPFPVNSFGWDPWFLFEHKRRHIPVIDLTPTVRVVHQNHESREANREKWSAWLRDPYAMRLLRDSGGFSHMMTLRDADYHLRPSGLARRPILHRLLSSLATRPFYREALGAYRDLKARARR